MEAIKILEYQSHLQPHFEKLNREWIEKYFVMEQVDVDVVTHPQELIIDQGGVILFASQNEEILGTVALKKKQDDVYELTKMAVSVNARGKGIGFILGEAILKKARDLGAKEVILYSNRGNNSIAVNLYYRLGFKEIKLEEGAYDRADIKMLYDISVHDYLKDTANRLLDIVSDYREKFDRISSKDWNEKQSLTRWSRKEILGHLIDSAANNHQRFVRAQYAEKLLFPAYQQNECVIFQNYQHAPAQQLIDLWFHYNRQLAWIIENIHHEKLDIICIIGDDKPVTLKFLVEDYIEHLVHHLQQIA